MTSDRGAGRYAPTPSGDLHIGNLRTAVAAWLAAAATDRGFAVRVDDLDEERCDEETATRQLEDLAALGVRSDREVVYQSRRGEAYRAAAERLAARGLVYECYCSRREIREAQSAPHATPGRYPGTCRNLSESQRRERRARLKDQGRAPALRLRAQAPSWRIEDRARGSVERPLDDIVLRRGGQQPGWAYHLAVVVDDAYSGVDQVVRGADLLDVSPTQAYLASLLGLPEPSYAHVSLVLDENGERLAKRSGAPSGRDLAEEGWGPGELLAAIGRSLGRPGAGSLDELAETFDPSELAGPPVRWPADFVA